MNRKVIAGLLVGMVFGVGFFLWGYRMQNEVEYLTARCDQQANMIFALELKVDDMKAAHEAALVELMEQQRK